MAPARAPAPPGAGERRLSIRLIWPFFRIVGANAAGLEILARERIGAAEFANPDTRIRHRAAIELLERTVEETGDGTIGLRAGQSIEPGDLDALEYAARSCPTLGDAIRCSNRYMQLMNEAAETALDEHGGKVVWSFRTNDGVPYPPAANDFVVACADRFARFYTGVDQPADEVRLMHPKPAHAREYERLFRTRVRFGAPHNAIVFPRGGLALPMKSADRRFHFAFDMYARELVERIPQTVAGRAREVAVAELRGGRLSMASVARALGLSVPTLRRRLADEGTSYAGLVDQVRRDLVEQYLRDPQVAVGEMAFLLGFSHVTAFYKAFRRWTGTTPAQRRAELRAGRA